MNIYIYIYFHSAEYAKKNGLTHKKRMLAILGVSVAVMFLLVVSVVFCFVMKKKKGKEVYSNLKKKKKKNPISVFLRPVNKCSQDYSNTMFQDL